MTVACRYSDGTIVIAEDAAACPAFRDDTGGMLEAVEALYSSGESITVETRAPRWPASFGWILLLAAIAYEKMRKR